MMVVLLLVLFVGLIVCVAVFDVVVTSAVVAGVVGVDCVMSFGCCC